MLFVKYVPQKCDLFKTSAVVMVHCTLCEGVLINMNIKVNDKHANYHTTNYYICSTVLCLTLKINDTYKRNL